MNNVDRWIDSGAEVTEGLRLLNIYAPNAHLSMLVSLNPKKFACLLIKRLQNFGTKGEKKQERKKERTFRENWPFLSEPSCPPELKILAADKITAWINQTEGHEKLFECSSLTECFETAKKVIENFIENRNITSEFSYYLEHGNILGKHPVFSVTKKIAEMRKRSILELIRRQRNLNENIWRIRNEIRKGDKPYLLIEREARLRQRELELQEINRIIDEYSGK